MRLYGIQAFSEHKAVYYYYGILIYKSSIEILRSKVFYGKAMISATGEDFRILAIAMWTEVKSESRKFYMYIDPSWANVLCSWAVRNICKRKDRHRKKIQPHCLRQEMTSSWKNALAAGLLHIPYGVLFVWALWRTSSEERLIVLYDDDYVLSKKTFVRLKDRL